MDLRERGCGLLPGLLHTELLGDEVVGRVELRRPLRLLHGRHQCSGALCWTRSALTGHRRIARLLLLRREAAGIAFRGRGLVGGHHRQVLWLRQDDDRLHQQFLICGISDICSDKSDDRRWSWPQLTRDLP